MAQHEVSFTVPERPVGNVDIEFTVQRNGAKLGTLKISKGGLEWVPKDHTYGYHVKWQDFDDLAQTKGVKK